MRSRLHSWCRRQGAGEHEASLTTDAVLLKYRESHRHYHNPDHILSSLNLLDQLGNADDRIEGAIWFHDVIYDPTSTNNEAASACYFESSTSPWLDSRNEQDICRLILATDLKNPRTDDPLETLMVDIDLAILGSESAAYDAYRHAIRREYRHIPEADYKRGRTAILERFLAGKIYHSSDLQHLEKVARRNISGELIELADSRT